MTLFTLLIVMAIERVTTKSKRFHIATLAHSYFNFISNTKSYKSSKDDIGTSTLHILLIACIPTLIIYLAVIYLPGFLVFLLYLTVLWICLGCPVTRNTYRRYMQAANRDDFEACSLYSEKFGVESGELSEVGKQLVLVNYRQYASVIIFFMVLGLPGVVFYSICKEWYFLTKANKNAFMDECKTAEPNIEPVSDDATAGSNCDNHTKQDTQSIQNLKLKKAFLKAEKLLFYIDWLPVRITAFGFLLVGHFSKGLPIWLHLFTDVQVSAYQVLSKVAKASEEPEPYVKPYLQEPLQMVKLVKRNIIFLVMAMSIMTLVGLLG